MNLKVFLDIETLPPDEAVKDHIQQNILRDIANQQIGNDELLSLVENQYRKMALQAEEGRVLTIGIIIEENGQIKHRGLLGRDRATYKFHLDEAKTLRSFWKLMNEFQPQRDQVIGHNIFDFDLLFLYKRSIIQRVQPSVNLNFARYRSQPIFDTMREWERWGRSNISLDRLARTLGLESSKQNGIDGSMVYDHFCIGQHEEIAAYCMRDVDLVRAIYYRMTFSDLSIDF